MEQTGLILPTISGADRAIQDTVEVFQIAENKGLVSCRGLGGVSARCCDYGDCSRLAHTIASHCSAAV